MSTEPDSARRERALTIFARLIDCPPIAGVYQRGRDPDTARYTMRMADGQRIRIGTIRTLSSQAEFGRVLAVATGNYPPAVEQKDWRNAIRGLINLATDVDEALGETFADAVREWIKSHAADACAEREKAIPRAEPYIDDDQRLNVHVDGLQKYIRQHYGEQVKKAELWTAFAELGLEQHNANYLNRRKVRTTKSYYRIHPSELETEPT